MRRYLDGTFCFDQVEIFLFFQLLQIEIDFVHFGNITDVLVFYFYSVMFEYHNPLDLIIIRKKKHHMELPGV